MVMHKPKRWINYLLFIACSLSTSIHAQQIAGSLPKAEALTAHSSEAEIILSWQIPDGVKLVRTRLYRQLQGRHVPQPGQNLVADGGELLATLESSKTSYVDTHAEPGKRYIYRVKLFGEGNVSSAFSLPALATLRDVEPPQPVADLQYHITSSRQLVLRWSASISDDVETYRVYRAYADADPVITRRVQANGEKSHKLVLNPSPNTEITFRYQVAAVDVAGNMSPLSKPVEVRMPDDVPPQLPQQLRVVQSGKQMQVSWLANSEDDLSGYRVYRQAVDSDDQGSGAYQLLSRATLTDNRFEDTSVEGHRSYRYRVTAIDRFGNESVAGKGRLVRVGDLGVALQAPRQVVINKRGGKPYLKWSLPQSDGVKLAGVMVERSDGDGFHAVSNLIKAVDFTDASARSDKAYKYRLCAYSVNGKTSEYSREVMWRGEAP